MYRRLLDGNVVAGSTEQILSIGTTSRGPKALYSHASKQHFAPFGSTANLNGVVHYEPLNLARARALQPRYLIPNALDGLRLSFVARSPYTKSPNSLQEMPGLLLYYGPISNSGLANDRQPGYSGRWLQVIEFPHRNVLTEFFRGHFPATGKAVIDGLRGDIAPGVEPQPLSVPQLGSPVLTAHTATLKSHGRYYLINAATKADAVGAARSIGR